MASKEIIYKQHTFKLAYELVNPTQDKVLLVLHGWGSNKEIMKQAFGKTLPEYKHIYLDMPGFGKSTNDMVLTTEEYAEIVQLFLDTLGVTPTIAMGHSFGGKVSTLLNTPCLVLLSSAGVVTEKPWSIKLKIATVKFLKPLGMTFIRDMFKSKDVENMSHEMYETFKNVVDEDFEDSFAKSKSKALCFWGKEDTATPLYTGKKIAGLIANSQFYPLDGDHFFFLHHKDFIARTITKQCKEHN
ncbi:2-hydroxy-6-oxohepta-2,4-dienoate hydrolase [hydrothermal vent metagenome]|uniref:2-hydroxy-6-oxohepta-2,4-dienoate hydrolase n=1 Tax=hydrothermal vent metagenome TaxID=652676 RepID=A0A1W1BSX7_9ZZZZ